MICHNNLKSAHPEPWIAAVVALNRFESSDVRQEAVDLTANPFNT